MPEIPLSPSLLALCAAVLFGNSVIFAKVSMRHVPPFMGAWFSIGTTFGVLALTAAVLLPGEAFLSPWVFFFALVGLAQPFASISMAFAATEKLGPTIAGTIASTGPLFSASLAVLVLGETLTLPIALGTGGIVLGAMVLSWSGRSRRGWPLLALAFPLGTALARGIAHPAQKFGMEHLPNPLVAALMAYGAAFLAGLVLRAPRLGTVPHYLRTPGMKWLLLAGFGNAIAILAFTIALHKGTVVVVAPIGGSYPLFTLLFLWLFFRGEGISRRTVAGVALIVPSVALISLFR